MTLVDQLRDRFAVEPILRVLNIAVSTYYGWCKRVANPCLARRGDHAIHERSGATYGSPRVHATLRRSGIRVDRKRVERLMRTQRLPGAFLRKRWRRPSTRQDPRATTAPDLVNRDFTASGPDRLFSDRIVGWKTSDRCDTELVLGALEYAIWSRDVRDGQLIHHSDHGSTTDTSFRFANRLPGNGILPSMATNGSNRGSLRMARSEPGQPSLGRPRTRREVALWESASPPQLAN